MTLGSGNLCEVFSSSLSPAAIVLQVLLRLELPVLPLVSEVLLPGELGGVVMDSDGVLMAADYASDADDTTKGGVPTCSGASFLWPGMVQSALEENGSNEVPQKVSQFTDACWGIGRRHTHCGIVCRIGCQIQIQTRHILSQIGRWITDCWSLFLIRCWVNYTA